MKSPIRPMTVIQRPRRVPEGAFAVALLEGRVVRPDDAPPKGPLHVVAFREGRFMALTRANAHGGFVLQLPAGPYRLVAFEGQHEVASVQLAATVGVHEVVLTPAGAIDGQSLQLEFELDPDALKN